MFIQPDVDPSQDDVGRGARREAGGQRCNQGFDFRRVEPCGQCQTVNGGMLEDLDELLLGERGPSNHVLFDHEIVADDQEGDRIAVPFRGHPGHSIHHPLDGLDHPWMIGWVKRPHVDCCGELHDYLFHGQRGFAIF